MGRVKFWISPGRRTALCGRRHRFAFFLLFLAFGLWPVGSNLYSQSLTELGSEGDLTVLGTGGTAPDPNVEIKGFTVFGSTQASYAGAVVGPGNVTVNGVLSVSSGAYFVGNTTFTSAGNIYIPGGTADRVLASQGPGAPLKWLPISALGDNLGSHVATMTITAGYGIAASTISASTVTLTGFINTTSTAGYAMNGYTILRASDAIYGTFVGRDAGRVNTGSNNSFLGYQAGYSNTTGGGNSFVGWLAGYSNTTGGSNSFVGYRAGRSNTSGNGNSFLGNWAGEANTTGNNNSFVGYGAGQYNTTGWDNSFVGYGAGQYNQTGSANTLVGYYAGEGTSGSSFSNSTIMGYNAGLSLTTGSDNLLLGFQSGDSLTTGLGNIIIGYNQDASAPAAYSELNIGGVLYGDLSAKTIGISTRIPQAALDIVSTGTASNIYAQIWRDGSGNVVSSMTSTGVLYPAIPASDNTKVAKTGDTMTGQLTISGSSLTVGGNISVSTIAATGDITAARYQINGSTVLAVLPGTGSFGVGPGAGRGNAAGGNYNVFVGQDAGYSNTTGVDNVFVGHTAGHNNTTGKDNVFLGQEAGYYNVSGNWNFYLGTRAGINSTGDDNIFIGSDSGVTNITGARNMFIGSSAGTSDTGDENIFMGYYSGYYNIGGIHNTYVGLESGYRNVSGQMNSIFGYMAGLGVSGNSYSNNSLFGYYAGKALTTGSNNLLLGWQAGDTITSGASNIVIGYNQDASAPTASNELNIGGVLFGNLSTHTIGISTRVPQAALDIVSTGTASNIYAQIWRDGNGNIVSSMTSTGVLYPQPSPLGDNLGNHIATTTLNMAGFGIVNVAGVTLAPTASTPTAGEGGIYYDSNQHSLYVSTAANAAAWLELGPPTSCPTGMGLMGKGRSAYCIDLSDRAAATYANASNTCLNAGRYLCNFQEFSMACNNALGGTWGTSVWRWVADPYANTNNNAVIVGTGGCFLCNASLVTGTYAFRCCQR